MSETILTWNAPNFITVNLMYILGMFILLLILMLWNKARHNDEVE